MSVEEIKNNIKNYIIENCNVKNQAELDQDDLDILQAGIVNSINVVQYLAFLEDEYEIDLLEDDMSIDDVVNINRLSDLVFSKVAKAS